MKVGDLVKLITNSGYFTSEIRNVHGQLAIITDYNKEHVNPWKVLFVNPQVNRSGRQMFWLKHYELELV
jgi:hypothetical protein